MNKKEKLGMCFFEADLDNKKYIALKIKNEESGSLEVMIIGRESFETKWLYYLKAYDDDLKLKTFNKIVITDFCYANSYSEIENILK